MLIDSATTISSHDRQVRAFGAAAQRHLSRLTVAVVGLGGAGSLLAQGLAHLGIGRIILVDPDIVETSNLSRIVGSTPGHARLGIAKVDVAGRMITRIDPGILVRRIRGSVLSPDVWLTLRSADILLGAVDTHAARWALNALATQYARCYIDVGVDIGHGYDGALDVTGHVATVTPSGPCLLCMSGYDPRQVAAEVSASLAEAKRAAGYLPSAPEDPAPAVIFLNQAVTAVALGEVVNQVTGWRPTSPYVLVELTSPAMTALGAVHSPGCPACGTGSARGLGDAGDLPMPATSVTLPEGTGDGRDDTE